MLYLVCSKYFICYLIFTAGIIRKMKILFHIACERSLFEHFQLLIAQTFHKVQKNYSAINNFSLKHPSDE